MAMGTWPTSDGVGFNKKHDAPRTFKPAGPSRSSWGGFRRRRIIFALLAILAVWLFVKNMPTDVPPVGSRYSPTFGSLAPNHVQISSLLGKDKGNKKIKEESDGQRYEGSLVFPELVSTLRPHLSWAGNNNVLFALPELSSTSHLIPVACEMARNNRTSVHVAILGAQDVNVKNLLDINGLSQQECPVIWHDARPDHPLKSTQNRIEASIRAGLGHCCIALRPQVVLVDNGVGHAIDRGLIRGVVNGMGVSLVMIPEDTLQSIPWLTTLDHNSLKVYNDIQIEIVIQAYSESAGSLLRLLHSIQGADYRGLFYPRLTIELPVDVDPSVSSYLEAFQWPPQSSPARRQLTLLHRINNKKRTVAEASMRTLESFYPPKAATSHVLLLDADAELSTSYLHYLVSTLLEYKYSQRHLDLSALLFGISLELPSKTIDGQQDFLGTISSGSKPLIMRQMPNSNAALIMGDKWIELHKFLSHRLSHDPDLVKQSTAAKSVTEDYPAWLPEALDLMQAQGLSMLYPAFAAENGLRLVTLHQDLHHTPEEYTEMDSEKGPSKTFDVEKIMQHTVLKDDARFHGKQDNAKPMVDRLPWQTLFTQTNGGSSRSLPSLNDIPLFTFAGEKTDWSEIQATSVKFANDFSLQQGNCASLTARNQAEQGSVDYLFCEPG